MKKNRVIVIDHEPDVREGLRAWLSHDYDVILFDCAESFLAEIADFCMEDAPPTCLLLDFQMTGMNGLQLQRDIKRSNMAHPIIFMSGDALQGDIIDAWRGGALNFILKPFTAREVSDVLASSFSDARTIRHAPSPDEQTTQGGDLPITRREAQVLLLLGEGLQQVEVARKLGLSLRTVKMYRTFLRNKLNLNTLVEIGRYCEKNREAIVMMAE